MNENIIEVAGNQYQIGKLDAFKQFHVSRRLAPVLLALIGVSGKMQEILEGENMTAIQPMLDAISHLSDEDANYVIHNCLAVTLRMDGTRWARVFVPSGGLMYQDIDMPVMMRLVVAVIQENIGNFTKALGDTPRVEASPA